MNQQQFERMKSANGFIAALDQSGGSTPKALANYGVDSSAYANDEEMFDLVHQMRTRIIKSPAFNSQKILGAILFEMTMDRFIDGKHTGDYLWEELGVIPFLKIDKGLAELKDGVQMMKPIPDLEKTLERAKERNIFGTKMRSVIKKCNEASIQAIVDQQFEIGMKIFDAGLIPIIEPEVDINNTDKAECEVVLKKMILEKLDALDDNVSLMFKLTLPEVDDFYKEIVEHPRTLRFVALSGGYSRELSNKKLAANKGIIASFSRALTEGLNAKQSDDEFNNMLADSIKSIYDASIAPVDCP